MLVRVLSVIMLVVLPVSVVVAAGPFGERLLAKIQAEYGVPARERVVGWGVMMQRDKESVALSEFDKMSHANRYFNQVEWLSDIEHWGKEDYWATPIETLATNGGDCEDFSIGKYFSLLETDFAPEKLRITYVKSLTYNQPHMVLAYYETPGAEPLILDNINGEILPASQRPDLLPIYSFNGESIWLAKDRSRRLKGKSTVSLPQWKALNERRLEEFNVEAR